MPRSRVFLIDFSSGSQLASEAEDLLKSCSSASVDLQVVSARVSVADCDENSLNILVSQSRADLCMLIVPSAEDEILSLVSLVKRIAAECPVAVVVENCEALGLLGLLRIGASDFMIPPLRALDVVPRVLRLLEQTNPREARQFAVDRCHDIVTPFLIEAWRLDAERR